MARCATEHFTLTVPGDWSDRSMITWVAPDNGKRKVLPNILCSRDTLKEGEDLGAYVNRQLKELMNKVQNFDLGTREDTTFGGKPAVMLDFTMKPQGMTLRQRQVFFQPEDGKPGVSTVVATAAKSDFDAFSTTFDDIFNSVSWT